VDEKLKTLSPNTVRKHLANISKYLDAAVRRNYIPSNPVSRVEEIGKVEYTGATFLDEEGIKQVVGLFQR